MIKKSRKKASISVKSIRKYKEGYFIEPNQYAWGSDTTMAGDGTGGVSGFLSKQGNVDAINSGSQLASAGVNAFQPANGDTNAGLSAMSGALSGAGTGAKLGAAIGPEGALIGAGIGLVGGATYGLITGGKKHAAYERQQMTNTQNSYFNQRGNMQSQNVDPYGSQMADGDTVPKTGSKPLPTPMLSQVYNIPANSDPYWKLHPLQTEHQDGSVRFWGETPHPYVAPIAPPNFINPNNVLPSDKALGQSNTFYPSNTQPMAPSPATIHSNSGYYANGASVGLTGRATGKFYVPNAGLRRFAPHMQRVGKINPLPSNNINFNTTSQDSPQTMAMGDSVQGNNPNNSNQGLPVNSMNNQINVQKGELLIDPNKGKILQEYNGINPLTGGLYQPHAKGKEQESPNNFTLADPGLFVITKKTAKQYKDAIDNNDKIAQKTVLMNIRNAKIQKEGGLQSQSGLQDDSIAQGNYAYGDEVGEDKTWQNPNNPELTMPQNPAMFQHQSNTLYDGNMQPIDDRVKPFQYDNPSLPESPTRQSGISKFGDALTNYGPSIYNIGQGLFGNTQHQAYANPITNPYASNVIANMPKNVNMQPVINDIYGNQELANKSIEAQTNNAGVYRSNRQSLAASGNKALASARMQAAEVNNQAAGQRAYMYNALGYQNQQEQQQERQYNLGVDEINSRRQTAKSNLLNAGLGQLQQTAQNDKLNNKKEEMDKYTLRLLAQTFPNTRFYNEFQLNWAKDQADKLKNK